MLRRERRQLDKLVKTREVLNGNCVRGTVGSSQRGGDSGQESCPNTRSNCEAPPGGGSSAARCI